METWAVNGDEFNPDQFETLYWDGNSWGSMFSSLGKIGSQVGQAAKSATGVLGEIGKATQSGPLSDLTKTVSGAMGGAS